MRPARTLCLTLALAALGCSESGKIREWRPSDHDQPEEQGQVEGAPPPEQQSAQAEPTGDVTTEMLWRQQCMRCHGRDGSGGTPMAQRLPVADLRQSTLAEAEIVKVVTKGRREMPAFGEELDAEAIQALAKKVLSLRR